MRTRFEQQLDLLNNNLIEMGSYVEKIISMTTKALMEQNTQLAKNTISFGKTITNKEKEIEAMCLNLILRQQPVASDLRVITSTLKLITDLKRISDHATKIGEITLILSKREYQKRLEHIPQMADVTIKMVSKSIDAFVKKDINLAIEIINSDDELDNLLLIVKDELIQTAMSRTTAKGVKQRYISQAIELLMIAKYFERIGDHAANIGEWIYFSLTGKHYK